MPDCLLSNALQEDAFNPYIGQRADSPPREEASGFWGLEATYMAEIPDLLHIFSFSFSYVSFDPPLSFHFSHIEVKNGSWLRDVFFKVFSFLLVAAFVVSLIGMLGLSSLSNCYVGTFLSLIAMLFGLEAHIVGYENKPMACFGLAETNVSGDLRGVLF